MRCYVDSSALLRSILKRDDSLEKASLCERVASSELLWVECSRVLQRYRLERLLDDEGYSSALRLLEKFMAGIVVISLDAEVLKRAAGPFPTVIGTLDALHLASALLWREAESDSELHILTYDRQLELCAGTQGIRSLAVETGTGPSASR
jgi:predicted nucleic acid-binding protein